MCMNLWQIYGVSTWLVYQSLLSLANILHALVSHISIFVAFDIYLARVSIVYIFNNHPPLPTTHTCHCRVGGYKIIGITITIWAGPCIRVLLRRFFWACYHFRANVISWCMATSQPVRRKDRNLACMPGERTVRDLLPVVSTQKGTPKSQPKQCSNNWITSPSGAS